VLSGDSDRDCTNCRSHKPSIPMGPELSVTITSVPHDNVVERGPALRHPTTDCLNGDLVSYAHEGVVVAEKTVGERCPRLPPKCNSTCTSRTFSAMNRAKSRAKVCPRDANNL
jgi:hypothetical protein